MARKGVNLLEGDDDEDREDEPERDSGDDGGSFERRRGGFVDVLMVILFVCVMLGGVAWAGYQFWWLPKMKKAAQLKKERMKQEQQRKMRLAKMRSAIKRAQKAPDATGQFPRPAGSQVEERTQDTQGRNMQPGRPKPSRQANAPRTSAVPMMSRQPKSPTQRGNAPAAAVATMEKPTPPTQIVKTPSAAAAMVEKPVTPPKMKKPRREMMPAAQMPGKKAPQEKAAPRNQLAEKKPAATIRRNAPGARKPNRGFYYSVQVASCRTERCATSFLKRLESKGYSAFRVASTNRARRRGVQITEVRLGSFTSLGKARALASRAREKKIGAKVYRSNNQWNVAVGSFRNLEDAALLLDRVEDSGFRGRLASRVRSGGTGRLYTIRTGKFANLSQALAFRKKIRLAGFSDAIVVRRRLRK